MLFFVANVMFFDKYEDGSDCRYELIVAIIKWILFCYIKFITIYVFIQRILLTKILLIIKH